METQSDVKVTHTHTRKISSLVPRQFLWLLEVQRGHEHPENNTVICKTHTTGFNSHMLKCYNAHRMRKDCLICYCLPKHPKFMTDLRENSVSLNHLLEIPSARIHLARQAFPAAKRDRWKNKAEKVDNQSPNPTPGESLGIKNTWIGQRDL